MLSVLVWQLTSQAHWATILRVKGSVGIDSLFKALKGVDFSSPINHRGIARSLADYRPDVVAIQGNVLTIVEVGSLSQMSGALLLDSYRRQLVSIRDLAEQTLGSQPLKVVFRVFDTNGIEHILK